MNRTARLITSITFATTALVGISAPVFASPKSDAVNAARVENRARSQATYDANKTTATPAIPRTLLAAMRPTPPIRLAATQRSRAA